MAAVEGRTGPPTYGNWRKPESAGIGGFGLLGTGLLMASIIGVVLAVMLGGLLAGVIVGVVAAVALLALLVKDRHGRTGVARIANRVGWIAARRSGANVYRSGPLGRTPWGTFQLPGLAAPMTLHEAQDSYGRPFAILHTPATATYSVVLACDPDGASLVDDEQVDRWVAEWGGWLASLGHEPGIRAASVTIETAPDTGSRLRREVASNLVADAQPLARDMLAEVVATYPEGSAEVGAWVALTFAGSIRSGRRRTPEEMARDLASRLPGLTHGLAGTGAGSARPVTAQELCEIVRIAYDPAVAGLLADAHADGDVPELSWADVGPSAAQASWDSYRHDGAWSRTWSMTSAPRGEVFSSVLNQLLAPHGDIDRKRVPLLFRPLDPGAAGRTVENDKRNADFRISAAQKPSARALREARAAEATAREEARGAGLVNFGLVVTATVLDAEGLPDAAAAIDNLSATARVMLRPVYGSQDSAFAAGLPLGLVMAQHVKVPAEIRSAL